MTMSKKIIAYIRNGYGFTGEREFKNAEEYLEWKRENYEIFNTRNETYLEVIKVSTRWLPLDWRDFQ